MSGEEKNSSKVRAFMGQTPKNLKQKFFSVLGTSSEYKKQIISGISNKIDAALSFGSTSETTPENVNEAKVRAKLKVQHEKINCVEYSLDDHIVDYELRRVKEKRAHEEISSGCYRHPAFIDRATAGAKGVRISQKLKQIRKFNQIIIKQNSSSHKVPSRSTTYLVIDCNMLPDNFHSVDPSSKQTQVVSSPVKAHHLVVVDNTSPPSPQFHNNNNRNNQIDCTSTTTISHHQTNISLSSNNNKSSKALTTKENLLGIPPPVAGSCSSATSESGDNLSLLDAASISSLEVKMWQKSETESMAPSCSSIASLDTSSDEVTFEFMRRFVTTLFNDSTGITLELKHQFGQYARLASGRMWFVRFTNGQRTQSKKVSETTFYALIQYFAIILFECKDCEDFLPARHLMSLCFTFYQEVQVPGCEPYREYLFNYLRDQPIWHALRFWNAALFYALQKDKVPKVSETAEKVAGSSQQQQSRNINNTTTTTSNDDGKDNATATATANNSPASASTVKGSTLKQSSRSISESSVSSSSSSTTDNALSSESSKYKKKVSRSKSSTTPMAAAEGGDDDNTFDTDEQRKQSNMAFSHLGSLTCNMHAFGLSKDLCCEFLKKQSHILSLSKEQEKMLNENVNRLYRETDPWRE